MSQQSKDFRLAGSQATVAEVVRLVHRQIKAPGVSRIEVRFSRQSREAFSVDQAFDRLTALVKESGLSCQVSVRAHELPLDDARGEHVVRLFGAVPKPAPAQAQAPAWARWVRGLPLIGRLAPATATSGGKPARPVNEWPAVPDLPRGQAVELLCKALSVAAANEEPHLHDSPVHRVKIIVRRPELHKALQPVVDQAAQQAAAWLRKELASRQRVTSADLRVIYAYALQGDGERTQVVGRGDLEVQLLREPEPEIHPAQPAGAEGATALPVTLATAMLDDRATAMPERSGPALTLRVLGTTHERFIEPFELCFDALPARFDRAALHAGGFGRLHGQALTVASQSCPLTIDRAGDGGLRLHATARASGSAMYFRDSDRSGIVGTVDLPTSQATLIVNEAQGLVDPTSRERLYPLVIELQLREPASALH